MSKVQAPRIESPAQTGIEEQPSNSAFEMFLRAANPKIVEHITIPPRPARYASIPDAFAHGKTGEWMRTVLRGGQLWHHQALAIEKLAAGANLVISTSTASGKSLVFQAAVMKAMLERGERSLVLYTQKALLGDQQQRWGDCLEALSLPRDLVGAIYGDVSMADRETIIATCPIILATEDVAHAYLMRQSSSPTVQRLLKALSVVVIDEAHALEGVFGSSSAFLFRRLRAAVASARREPGGASRGLQFVAATATIADPVDHLTRLTGLAFEEVTEGDNGAPFHGMDLLHIEGPKHGAPAEKMAADILAELASKIAPNAAIAFVDGRQAAERITQRVGRDDVRPYRSGYKLDERREIEVSMRKGTLRAVVATSALELGIDVPGFVAGMTLGVPPTRKALRQRIGRAGRAQPAVFAVIAPSTAFAQLGTSFRDYVQGPVEQSPLYLANRVIQYQHACCLLDEVTAIGGRAQLPKDVEWPDGFAKMFEAAQPGNPRPRDLEQITLNGRDSPHTAFSLRHIGGTEYRLRGIHGTNDSVGTIDLEKALREAFPGATYRHNKTTWRVTGWRSTPYEHSIMLKRIAIGPDTQPMLNVRVGVSHNQDAIIDHRLRGSERGSIAELSMRVVESVEGYSIGGQSFPYRVLKESDRAMQRKAREFSTTGILLRISEPFFEGSAEAPRATRRAVGEALRTMLARERCISPSELRFAYTQIDLHTPAGPVKVEDAVVIFDGVAGGLRLTASLYDDIARYLDRCSKAVDLAGPDAMLSRTLVDQLMSWESELEHRPAGQLSRVAIDTEERVIFAPGSEVAIRVRGELHERCLLEPQLMWIGDDEQLGYRYETSPGVSAWIPHDKVESVGANWRHVIWNARSGLTREIEA